jgi:sulfur-carrier protein adenylyltransferase/sulfurtransferase
MPETLLTSGSEFDSKKALLGQWLRDNLRFARPLVRDVLGRYGGERRFVSGWHVEVEHEGTVLQFYVLLGEQFPYSAIRVSLLSDERYLKWPHVEPGGLLCLPHVPPPTNGIITAVKAALLDAARLVLQCQDQGYVDQELGREFLSYWDRSTESNAIRVRSLLDPANRAARHIHLWRGKHYTLVGETPHQLHSWLKNNGRSQESQIERGVFGFLQGAPIPPFADRPSELCDLLQGGCPDALARLRDLPIDHEVTIILAAASPSGDGLVAAELDQPKLNGFRRGHAMNAQTKFFLWRSRSRLTRQRVDRFDAAWVHGRGRNTALPPLAAATLLMVGCGSLGSQVAIRLAQAGVGGMYVLDPETLVAANVGRHALGIGSVGRSKATELADVLRRHYPHMHTVEALAERWQTVYQRLPEVFANATLVVACLGDWAHDGQLGELHGRADIGRPVVYGWLDEFGSASHALALDPGRPALSCVLSPDGRLRVPETQWDGDGLLQAEPACGSLFQPYGALDVAHAEALVSRLCIDVLTDAAAPPVHRVYAGPTASLEAAGGEWSEQHREHRPAGYDGPFEYTRPVNPCGVCSACTQAP